MADRGADPMASDADLSAHPVVTSRPAARKHTWKVQVPIVAVWLLYLATVYLFPPWRVEIYAGRDKTSHIREVGRRFRFAPPVVDPELLRSCRKDWIEFYGEAIYPYTHVRPVPLHFCNAFAASTSLAVVAMIAVELVARLTRRRNGVAAPS